MMIKLKDEDIRSINELDLDRKFLPSEIHGLKKKKNYTLCNWKQIRISFKTLPYYYFKKKVSFDLARDDS